MVFLIGRADEGEVEVFSREPLWQSRLKRGYYLMVHGYVVDLPGTVALEVSMWGQVGTKT